MQKFFLTFLLCLIAVTVFGKSLVGTNEVTELKAFAQDQFATNTARVAVKPGALFTNVSTFQGTNRSFFTIQNGALFMRDSNPTIWGGNNTNQLDNWSLTFSAQELTFRKTNTALFQLLGNGQLIGNGSGLTNIPITGLQSGGATNAQILTWNGTTWAASNSVAGAGGGVSEATVTNIANYIFTNGSVVGSVVQTNFNYGGIGIGAAQFYTNTSGSVQLIGGTVVEVFPSASNPTTNHSKLIVAIDQSGGNSFTAVPIFQIYSGDTNGLQIYSSFSIPISSGAVYYFTNASQGAGTAAIVNGTVTTLGSGGGGSGGVSSNEVVSIINENTYDIDSLAVPGELTFLAIDPSTNTVAAFTNFPFAGVSNSVERTGNHLRWVPTLIGAGGSGTVSNNVGDNFDLKPTELESVNLALKHRKEYEDTAVILEAWKDGATNNGWTTHGFGTTNFTTTTGGFLINTNYGAGEASLFKAFPVAANETARIAGTIVVQSNTSPAFALAMIGITTNSVAAVSGNYAIGAGINGAAQLQAFAFEPYGVDGTNFTPAGTYRVEITIATNFISATIMPTNHAWERIIRTPRSNYRTITGIWLYQQDITTTNNNLNSWAVAIGNVAARKDSYATIQPRSGFDGLSDRVIYGWDDGTNGAGNQGIRVAIPANYDSRYPAPLLINSHGTSMLKELETMPNAYIQESTDFYQAMLNAGVIVASSEMQSEASYGNNAGIGDIDRVLNWVRNRFAVSSVFLVGTSAGMVGVLNYVAAHSNHVNGVMGLFPVTDMYFTYTNVTGYSAGTNFINAAYGAVASTYSNLTYNHDPMLINPNRYFGVPMRLYASAGDTQIPMAQNTTAFTNRIAGQASEISVYTASGAHGSGSHYQPADALQFMSRAWQALNTNSTVNLRRTNTFEELAATGNLNVRSNVTAASFIGSGSGITNLPAAQLTGTVPFGSLPAEVLTNGQTGPVNFADSLSMPTLYAGTIALTNVNGGFWTNLTGIFRGITNTGSLVNAGQVRITPAVTSFEHLRINHTNGNHLASLGSWPADPARGALWLGNNTEGVYEYAALAGNTSATYLNGLSFISFSIFGLGQWYMEADVLYPAANNTKSFGKAANRILEGYFTGVTITNSAVYVDGGFKTTAGTLMTNLVSATAALDFGNILAATSADLTITVSGAKANDSVHLGLPAAPDVSIVFNAFVSAANTVTVRAFNVGAIAVDQASATFRVTVHQF